MAPRCKDRRWIIEEQQTIENNLPVQDPEIALLSPSCSLNSGPVPPGPSNSKNCPNRRAYHPKVVTGCLTCKRRHLKCDETKPNCLRCRRSSRQCDGYIVRKAWIFEPSGTKVSDMSANSALLQKEISTEQGTDLGTWAFQYFCEVATPAMAEWTFASSAQDFWFRHVRQCATSIPGVRHLAVALAGRHKCTSNLAPDEPSFASGQYLQALSWLIREKEAICVDTVLLCCILIAVYEHLDPHTECYAGLSHLAAAFRIMNDPSTTWTSATRAMYSIALQVETAVSIFRTPIVLPGAEPTVAFDQSIPHLPEAFQSAAQMQRTFFEIFRWRFLYSLYHREWTSDCSGFHQLHKFMRQWYGLVCNFICRFNEENPASEDLQLAKTMSVQFRMIYAALWYSISDKNPKHQRPGHANLVGLSDSDEVTVFVPFKVDPQYDNQGLRLESGTCHKPTGIWPVIEIIGSPDQSRYVRFTAYASAGGSAR
ncbi:uncharacterized protein A1O5_06611 [Cladophialophora psammophila CBS 110553]|uniref:Zn(2)-C6 fungal-type domain-containing protein n=1 Tax=Cladophialophora psammophila CBS 110553 TaxID=1182543 RepID=W9X0U2_9EURO|nr:uncharacterized protein A1O5_06611 [Cladophialophora psammophila CBS 110553]EXJ70541.1 hypothetical protein A1O5_06611 [Cladophialophora psammophila CBS 110553]